MRRGEEGGGKLWRVVVNEAKRERHGIAELSEGLGR